MMPSIADIPTAASRLWPGFAVATVIAITAQFLSEHYGAPAMLMALLLGIAFHFISETEKCTAGIEFTSRTVLRIGVALLGARISVELLIGLGPQLIALVIGGVLATIGIGYMGARLLGRGWRFGLLTGGSVAICGASAAMAISAVLPKNEHSERNLIFTVLAVTVLSTVAMVIYPLVTLLFQLDDRAVGVFLGGTIHDVAQVVGAGFSVSQETGEVATLVKLIRVTMLAPVVLIIALCVRQFVKEAEAGEGRPPLVPFFVAVFLFFAALNSNGLLPQWLITLMGEASGWALLIAIAAVGVKTSLSRIFEVGGQAIWLIVFETLFIAGLVLAGILWLGQT